MTEVLGSRSEICDNPYDLYISIRSIKRFDGKYAINICRGRMGKYKMLLSMLLGTSSRLDAVSFVRHILEEARQAMGPESQWGEEVVDVLNQAKINEIIRLLKANDWVDTSANNLLISI